jgi:hypothetical protein
MHKSAMKCNKTIGKWCKNKHGASKIIDKFETYHCLLAAAVEVPPTDWIAEQTEGLGGIEGKGH